MSHTPGKEALALYGSLMRGLGGMERAGVRSGIRYVGPCIIEGILFDLGSYPGILPRSERVTGVPISRSHLNPEPQGQGHSSLVLWYSQDCRATDWKDGTGRTELEESRTTWESR